MLEKLKNFDEMITPAIIKVIYWLGIIIVAILAIVSMVGAIASGQFRNLIGVLLTSALSFLMVRVYCELIILGFRAVTYLKDINKKLDTLNHHNKYRDYE